MHQLEDGKLDFPFTQEQYLANEPVIRSLRAMDIELDKFWYAMLFVYDLVRERTEGVMKVPLSDFDQLRAFAKYMIDHPHAKLKVWEGRSHGVTVDSSLTIKCIRDILTHNSGKFCDTLSMSSLLAMGDFSENLSNVYKITFAVKCFFTAFTAIQNRGQTQFRSAKGFLQPNVADLSYRLFLRLYP
ncbi:MAG: hypothetical protein ACLR1G_01810 [Alistipes indistinctus]